MSLWLYGEDVDFDVLKGWTFRHVERGKTSNGDDWIAFEAVDGVFVMYHQQDCCESVRIDDLVGDLSDLVGTPILYVDDHTQRKGEGVSPAIEDDPDSYTWTFYNIRTIKGSVTIRWYGSSSGYYSERVDFMWLKGDTILSLRHGGKL